MTNSGRSGSLMSRQNNIVEESITIPSQIKYVREVSSTILNKIKPRNIDEGTLFDIRLCVEETVRNAIEHGSRNNSDAKVKIYYRIEEDKFIFEVEDEGSGFDYRKIPDPTHDDNIMKASGRGIYLVLRMMDKVEFNDKGNRIKLLKYL